MDVAAGDQQENTGLACEQMQGQTQAVHGGALASKSTKQVQAVTVEVTPKSDIGPDQGQAPPMLSLGLDTVRKPLSCQLCHELVASSLVMHCSHVFCGGCLFEHLNVKPQCPTCQVNMRAIPVRCLALDQVSEAFVALQDADDRACFLARAEDGKGAANKINKMFWWLQAPMAVNAPDQQHLGGSGSGGGSLPFHANTHQQMMVAQQPSHQPPMGMFNHGQGGSFPFHHNAMQQQHLPSHGNPHGGQDRAFREHMGHNRRCSDPNLPRPGACVPPQHINRRSTGGGVPMPRHPVPSTQSQSAAATAAFLNAHTAMAQQNAALDALLPLQQQYQQPYGSQFNPQYPLGDAMGRAGGMQGDAMGGAMTQLQEQMQMLQMLQQVSMSGWQAS